MGEAKVMPSLARALARQGHSVDLLRAWNEWQDFTPEEGTGRVSVVSLKTRRFAPIIPDISFASSWAAYRLRSGVISIAMLPGLVGYLRSQRPDVLIARMLTVPAVIGKTLSNTSTKLVLSMAGMPRSSTYRNLLWPRVYPMADAYVAPTPSIANIAAERARMNPEQFEIIPNPVIDSTLLQMAEEPLDHPWFGVSPNPVILGVGRLTRQKGFETLVRAVAIVRRSIPARLVIFGEGEDKTKLANLALDLGINEHVDLAGWDENPYRYMKAADVFAMSSEWEGPGHVLIEAQAIGVPVVSTDCPAGPKATLLDGAAGLLVPVGDAPAMASALLTTLNSKVEASVRVQSGLNNRDRYFPDSVASKWSTFLNDIT